MAQELEIGDVPTLVPDGTLVALGGMGLSRKPIAMVRELVAAQRKQLRLLTLSGSIDVDLLVANGCVSEVRAAFVALDVFGPAKAWKRAVENSDISHLDESLHSLTARLRASVAGLSFMPGLPIGESDLVRDRDDVRPVACPFTGVEYPAWQAVRPDVALIHAAEADTIGNAILGGHPGIDALLAAAATTTILSAERIVESLEHGGRVDVPGLHIDYVVSAPQGALPTGCEPVYPVDYDAVAEYSMSAASATAVLGERG